MKWFKHLSGALNDSLIFEAIEKFGGDGYLVFFGTLEMMSDEFDINNPGVVILPIKKLTKNFQLSRQKTVRILAFFDQKAKISPEKTKSFFVEVGKTHATINCPKLKDLCDEWTKRQLRSNSEVTTELLPPLETEEEEETELLGLSNDKPGKPDSFKLPKIGSKHFADKLKNAEEIKDICKKVIIPNFNPYQFVQGCANKNCHPTAIYEALEALTNPDLKVNNPYPYATAVVKTKSQNYHEAEHMQQSKQFKSDWGKEFFK
uniref:Uncharacterized protein n=1 Tax=viral metagenome TaxID=1070528 RepID=A0A6M3X9Q2_9ZZZZ